MKEVPVEDMLNIAKRISIPKKVESEIMFQDPFIIWLLFREFEQRTGIDLEGEKVLDLGSGHGTALAVGESHGMKMYGVEKREDMISISREELKRAGFHPQVEQGDYFSPAMASLRFEDGTQISEIKYFYIFVYTGMIYREEGGHTAKVVKDFFLKDFVSPGSYLLINPNHCKSDEWYESQPIDVMCGSDGEHEGGDLIIKKRKK